VLELDTWPADILDQFVRRARAVAGADATLTADQVAGLSTSAANGELNTWGTPELDGFIRRVIAVAGLRVMPDDALSLPPLPLGSPPAVAQAISAPLTAAAQAISAPLARVVHLVRALQALVAEEGR